MSSSRFRFAFSVCIARVGGPLCLLAILAALNSASAQQQPPAPAKSPSQPTEAPLIPGLPPLPPGVELPDDVKAFLNKAMQDGNKSKSTPAGSAKPAAKAKPAKTSAAKATFPPRPRAAAATTFQRSAKETPRGDIGDLELSKYSRSKPRYWISPDGRRFACLIPEGIQIDGQAYRYKRDIKPETFRFSPDSTHTVFVAKTGDQGETLVYDGIAENRGWNSISHHGAVFSPDSQHVAYFGWRYAQSGTEYVLMIDGQEREVVRQSPAWAISFTSDNRRVLWGESLENRYEIRETSMDGSQPRIEHKYGPAVLTMNFFYGGGGQLGLIAKEADKKFFVAYDGKDDGQRFEKISQVLLSDDGQHLAYLAEPASFRRVIVKNGQASKVYGGLDADYVKESLVLSADGRRWAYAIKKRNAHFAVIDGKESKAYRSVSGLTFSKDSQHVAYRAQSGNKLLMVVDGREGAGYDELGIAEFSPDGNSVAYAAGQGQLKFVVLNGQNQLPYTEVTAPHFAPHGNRLIYQGALGADTEWLINDGGREGKPYDVLMSDMYFGPDRQRLAAVAYDGRGQMVVVDGVEGQHYDTVITLAGGQVHFTSPNRFHYLAARGQQLLLVEEEIR